MGNLWTCGTCRSFGVVKGEGPKAGRPYRTHEGALASAIAVPCPTCTRPLDELRSALRPRSERH